MQKSKISESLLELSDAIEHLALILDKQQNNDDVSQVEQFELIVDKFVDTTKAIDKKDTNTFADRIKAKHKKGFLEDWLQEKNIYIGKSIETLKVDEKLYKIADFLSDHYSQLKDFYNQLKRNQVKQQDFKTRTSTNSITYIKEWSKLLKENKIIDSFEFLNNNIIDIDIAEVHNATYFINGYWLEILLRKEIAKVLHKYFNKIKSFDILAQVELVKPNLNNTELDLLLMINEKIYWFESKSGKIGKYYNLFAQHKRLLNLKQENCLLVVPAMVYHQANVAKERSGMTMLYGTDLEKQLPKLLFNI